MRQVVAFSVLAVLIIPMAHAMLAPQLLHENMPGPPTDAPMTPTSMQAPGDQEMVFVCPGPNNGEQQRFGLSINMVYTCPRRVYDNTVGGNQGWLMGNIRLSINPEDPNQLAFFSLHGSPSRNGPQDYARTGLTHSTYPSYDLGNSFSDEYTSTDNNGGQFGLESAGALDRGGHMYVGYLWATQQGPGYDHTIYVYKGDTTAQSSQRLMPMYGPENAYVVMGRQLANTISELQLIHYPAPEPPEDDGNETHEPGEVGEYARNVTGEGLVVMTFHEQAIDPRNSTIGSAWIDIHWTEANHDNSMEAWSQLPKEELIGPCRDASNPAVWNGRIYVACAVDRGYDARSRARVGEVDIWSFDPRTETTRFESYTGLNGDHPRLAMNDDGYMAVVTSRVMAEQSVEVRYSLGWYGQQWTVRGQELGPVLHKAMGGKPILDAHVTGIDISETERTVFAIYKEWNPSDPEPTVDPNDPLNVRLEGYKKFIFSFNECTPIIAGAEFNLGTSPDLYQREGLSNAQNAFNDIYDGLQAVTMPNGQELAFFAVGDYGAAQFGAVDVLSAISDNPCPFVPPVPAPPPVPLPLAASLASGQSIVVGSVVGTGALAMVGYLLTVKRKNPFLAATKSKK